MTHAEPMGLAHTLQVLADRTAGPAERDTAGRSLLTWCQARVPAALRKDFRGDAIDDDWLEEAQHRIHLAVASQSSTNRFRGTTDGEAAAWCLAIANNATRDRLRQRKRERADAHIEERSDGKTARAVTDVAHVEPDAAAMIESRLAPLAAALAAARAAGAIGPVRHAHVICFVEHRLGLATIEQQIERRSPPQRPGPQSWKQARDRIYQYRKRGAREVAGVLSQLVAEGRLAPVAAGRLAELLGVEWLPAAAMERE